MARRNPSFLSRLWSTKTQTHELREMIFAKVASPCAFMQRADKCRPSGKARSLPKRPTRRHCSAPFQLPFAPKTNTADIGKAVLRIAFIRLLIIYFAASGRQQIPHSPRARRYFRLRSLDWLCRISNGFFPPFHIRNVEAS